MEIKPTRIIKGQGLAKMLAKGNEKALNIGYADIIASVLDKLEHYSWFVDIIYYLKNLTCPNNLSDCKRRALQLKTSRYCLIQKGLGWRNPDSLVLRCVDEDESRNLIKELHVGLCGGNYAARTIAHKILTAG
jgi:hypothetical protein